MSAPGGNELVVLNKAFDRSVLPIQYSTCFDFRVLALLGTLIYIYISAYICTPSHHRSPGHKQSTNGKPQALPYITQDQANLETS